ncbi:MAG: LysR family transcriptional regulator, partial [Alphaproteobacteria bacterium]|nr:LysR family transcriptional regulator [Alphaproteobacteria bacterium]
MNWDKLRSFHLVAEHRNIAHASEHANISPSAMSRQIAALEKSLGGKLFHRHARGLSLTEQGQILYETVHEMMEKLAVVESQIGESRSQPRGTLRIGSGISVGGDWISPLLAKFIDRYPDIRIQLTLSDHLNVTAGEVDVAFLYERPTSANLVQRRIMGFQLAAYAAPAYLAVHGFPKTLGDLDNHRIITYDNDMHFKGSEWLVAQGRRAGRERRSVFSTNNTFAMRRAASTGMGIASIPTFMARGRADLVRVLTDEQCPNFDLWAVYPDALRGNRRVQAIIELSLIHI